MPGKVSSMCAVHVVSLVAAAATGAAQATDVAVCTDQGRFVIELADEQAPKHVANFLAYVDMAYYTGTVFHRVVEGFVVQGGGFDRQLRGHGPLLPSVENESHNGLLNERGTVAAARTSDPDSATAQFFVNLTDNKSLNAGDEPGYTVFGRVKDGLDVLDAIAELPTGPAGPFRENVPTPLVAIDSIARIDEAALAALPVQDRDVVLKQQIAEADAAGNHAEALRLVDLYRAACAAPDPQISVIEAKAALAMNARQRARFVLEDFFTTTDRADPAAEEAAALYRSAMPAVVTECTAPAAPQIPDGNTATRDAMVAGQTAVKEFVAASETYLACLSKVIDDQTRAAEQRSAAIGEHNRVVTSMESVANNYNEQLRVFNARQ